LNILLTDSGVLKITDFCLAKNLDGTGTATPSGAGVGTPSYIPPEQARGLRVDPTADVYALGAVLYEMLTGRPPFLGPDPLVVLHQVVHDEPVAVRRLQPAVPRDLETICLKCLRKEPARRYATALELAEDIQRFQRGEAMQARPAGRVERLTKWAHRRPAVAALSGSLLVATLLLVAALVVGILVSTDALAQARAAEQAEAIQKLAAEKARDDKEAACLLAVANATRAENAAAAERAAKDEAEKRLRQIDRSNKILTALFDDLNPWQVKGGPLVTQLSQRLDQVADLLDEQAVGDSLATARLQLTLGRSLVGLGHAEKAIVLFTKVRRSFEKELGPDHAETLLLMHLLGNAYRHAGQVEKAVPLLEQTLGKQRRFGGDRLTTLSTMSSLAMAYTEAKQPAKALPLLQEALMGRWSELGPDHPDTLDTQQSLAWTYLHDKQADRALPLLVEVLARRQRVHPPDHYMTLATMNILAGAYFETKQLARAQELYEMTLAEQQIRSLGSPRRYRQLAQGVDFAQKTGIASP
jgi:tetratricopeptide (TPR) repeat protein